MSQPRILNKNRLLVLRTVTRLTNSFTDNEKLIFSLHTLENGVSRLVGSHLRRSHRSEVKVLCFRGSEQTHL